MKGIRQLDEKRWKITVDAPKDPVTGKRRQISRNVHGTRRDAVSARARLMVEVGAGTHVGHAATVAQLVEAWMAKATHLSPSTRRDYRSTIDRHLPAAFAATPIWKVRAADIDSVYAARTKAGAGAARVRRLHQILANSFGQAVRWGWIARSPVTDASPPPVRRRPPQVPDVAEVSTLLAAADGDLRCWLLLEAVLGARRGEICGLQWGDIDLDQGGVVIRRALVDGGPHVGVVVKGTKTDRVRTAALDGATVAVLREHRRAARERALAVGATIGAESWVFALDAESRSPWRPDSATHRFARLRTEVGLEHVQLKNLRHFVATQLLAAGVDPKTVSQRLGHARTSTTLDVYAAAVPARDRAAADLLGSILRSG